MGVYITETFDNMKDGLDKMKEAMIEDYKGFMPPEKSTVTEKMNQEFVENFQFKFGNKYIKVITKNSVAAFIVNTDKDKKFKMGDILLPAGWAAPARNHARGNILDGNYEIAWTGACYIG